MLDAAGLLAGVLAGEAAGAGVGTTVGATATAGAGVGAVTGIVAGFVTGFFADSFVVPGEAGGFVAAGSEVGDPAFGLSPIVWLAVPGGTGASAAMAVCVLLSAVVVVDSTVVEVVVVAPAVVVSFVWLLPHATSSTVATMAVSVVRNMVRELVTDLVLGMESLQSLRQSRNGAGRGTPGTAMHITT